MAALRSSPWPGVLAASVGLRFYICQWRNDTAIPSLCSGVGREEIHIKEVCQK